MDPKSFSSSSLTKSNTLRFKEGKKELFFASDFHLGIPDYKSSLAREKEIVRWLDQVAPKAAAIFLVGDLFDFWFEYRYTAPKGYTRLLGKLAEITDSGIPVYTFLGNHDMWQFGYLEQEVGVTVFPNKLQFEFLGKRFFIAHGDGLGPGDKGYKFIKRVFRNPFNQWLFARIHPNLSFGMAQFWSGKSREHNHESQEFLGEKEFLYQYCIRQLTLNPADYYIFGHRHLALDIPLPRTTSRYINLGEWFNKKTYGHFSGNEMALETYAGS